MTPDRPLSPTQPTSRDGWPLPPPLHTAWMARRARRWLQLARAGQVHRMHADLSALQGGFRVPKPRRLLVQYGEALRREWRSRIAAGPAGPALARADHANYLGDRAVVRGLVDGYIALLIARAGGAVPHDACEAEMRRLSRVFAGQDRGYAPIGGWNTLDGLGASAVARGPLPPVDGADLATVLAEMFALTGLAVLRTLRAAERSQLGADAAVTHLSAIARRASAILLGTADAEPAEATLSALVADLPELS